MMKRIMVLIALMLTFSLLFAGCDKDQSGNNSIEATQNNTEDTVSGTEDVLPVYETKKVSLCVRTTREMWDGSSISVEEYEYDEFGNMIAENNVTYGDTTTHQYDDNGNLISTKYVAPGNSYGTLTQMTYNEKGNLLTKTTTLLDRTPRTECTYTYDEAGFLVDEVCTQHYDDTVYHYVTTYNEDHTEATVMIYKNNAPDGKTVETYNADGNLLRSDSYDAQGNWTKAVSCEYDSAGRLTVEWNYSESELQADYDVIYTYDENGLLTNVNVDYYYGYGTDYEYETFEIKVRVN